MQRQRKEILEEYMTHKLGKQAMKLSGVGVAHFSQKHFDQVKGNVREVYCSGTFSDSNFVDDLIMEMFEYFTEEISLFTRTELVKAGIDEISTRGFLIENRKDICTSPIIN